MTTQPVRIRLFEHQELPYGQVEALCGTPKRKERLLEALEQLNLTCQRTILHLGRKSLWATSYVGVIQAPGLTIELLPKIDHGSEANRAGNAHNATRNLLSMLSAAYHFPPLVLPAAGMEEQSGHWMNLLARLFVNELRSQVSSGLSHQYLSQEDTLPALRGRWNVQRQTTRGQAHPGFEVIYESFSADTPLNQVLRLAVRQLASIVLDPRTHLQLEELDRWFEQVALPSTPLLVLKNNIHFDRLNERFRPAYHMARMFLEGSIAYLNSGAIHIPSFLVDMNLLFEQYITTVIQQQRASIFPSVGTKVHVVVQSTGSPIFLASSEGKNAFRLRPDIAFYNGARKEPFLIADTKYKVLATKQATTGDHFSFNQEDIYQALAYAIRTGCSRALLLYPEAGQPVRKRFVISAAGVVISACTVNLRNSLDPPDTLVSELREVVEFTLD